jgi:hypothetical protein
MRVQFMTQSFLDSPLALHQFFLHLFLVVHALRKHWAIVTVAPSVESKWSTRKSRVQVVGDITHLPPRYLAENASA